MTHAATAVVLLLATACHAQTTNDPDYEQGYAAWKLEQYPDAADKLRRFRAKEYGERFEVDYWIGTSWCRMSGEERFGWDLLDWAMYAYPVAPDTRALFKAERDLCRQVATTGEPRAKPRLVVVKATGTGATARAEQTKIFYVPGGDRAALRVYPSRTKREIAVETFESRLVPLSEPDRAVAGVRALAPEALVKPVGRFILASASGHSSEELVQIGKQLDLFLTFLKREYEIQPPPYFITVYLVPDSTAIRAYADRIHGLDVNPATLGYAFQNDMTALAQLRGTGVGTLLHELFHLAVRSSYGAIPQWMDEGMASLYETCTLVGEQFLGEPNWRAIVLEQLGRGPSARLRLKDVITAPWFWDDPNRPPGPDNEDSDPERQAYMMALARNFALYLQETGNLTAMYNAYRHRQPRKHFEPAEEQAVRLVEQVTKRSINEVESDLWTWYPRVRDPNTRLHTGEAHEKQIRRDLPKSVDREPLRPN